MFRTFTRFTSNDGGQNYSCALFQSLALIAVVAVCAILVASLTTHRTEAQSNTSFAISAYQPWSGYGVQLGSWESGDFNGDGKDDLIHLWGSDRTNVWLSQGDGTFAISAYQPWSGYGVQLGSWESGDFNGDGKDDLIHLWGSDLTNVWLSTSVGPTPTPTTTPTPTPTPTPTETPTETPTPTAS